MLQGDKENQGRFAFTPKPAIDLTNFKIRPALSMSELNRDKFSARMEQSPLEKLQSIHDLIKQQKDRKLQETMKTA